MKSFFGTITGAAPSLLNSSLIAIPYLLFLKLIDGQNLSTILPLVIFYTLRMTGVFLLRSIKIGVGSYSVLIFTFILGFIGAVFGVLGTLYFPLFIVSAIFLGFSTAFIKPIFATINFHKKDEKKAIASTGKKKKDLKPIAFIVVFLIALMALPGEIQTGAVMLLYVALFAMALYATSRDKEYKFQFVHLKDATVSLRGAIIFIVFFILLIVLRIARRMLDAKELDAVAVWFSVAFLIAIMVVWIRRKHIKQPMWFNLISLTNGMCGNFLFIFGSFYIGALYGIQAATAYVYIPFVLGMGAGMMLTSKLQGVFKNVSPLAVQIVGMNISLILLMTPFFFPVSIFLVSFFFTGTSSWLDRRYYQTESIPYDRRMISKFTMQDIGSITYQFAIAILILVVFNYSKMPTSVFFTLTENTTVHSESLVAVMHLVKFLGCLILCVLFTIGLMNWRKSRKGVNLTSEQMEKQAESE